MLQRSFVMILKQIISCILWDTHHAYVKKPIHHYKVDQDATKRMKKLQKLMAPQETNSTVKSLFSTQVLGLNGIKINPFFHKF